MQETKVIFFFSPPTPQLVEECFAGGETSDLKAAPYINKACGGELNYE
jgi:hypothetical protein